MRLTRKTILHIIKHTPRHVQDMMLQNPNEYANECTRIIKEKLADQLIDGIKYTKINEWYEMTQFKAEIESWESYLKPATKSIYEEITCDSNVEKGFVDGLEKMEEVLLYIKLPGWFTVPTPIGEYNPDWAIIWQERDEHNKPTNKKLYLVYETKGTPHREDLRLDERRKIECGEKHFLDALKLDDYNAITTTRDMIRSLTKRKMKQ